MDNMSLSIKNAYQQPLSIAERVPKLQQTSVINSDVNHAKPASDSVQVEISDEAKQKKLQESNQQAHRKLMGKNEVEDAKGSDDKLTLDEMIKELQEEIAELTQEMVKLRSKGDEKSAIEAKSVEIQIASLTAQLMNLLTQKIEQGTSK